MSHRHELKPVGFDKVLPVEKYLEYFKQRSYTSAGVSPIDMGESDSANRSTADTQSGYLTDDVKDYQQEFKFLLEFEVIQELLLERFDISVLEDENIVTFDFHEIDTDFMMKKENHNWLGYVMGGMNEDEMRIRNNQPIIDSDDDRAKMYLNLYEIPKAEAIGKIDAENAKAVNTAKGKEQPSNQHKKNLGPTKRKSSISEDHLRTLSLIMSDLNKSSIDLTKIRLTNWLFTLDSAEHKPDFCINQISLFDEFLTDASDSLKESPVSTVKEILFNKIIHTLEIDEQNTI